MYNIKAMFFKFVFFFLLTSFYGLFKNHKANFVKTQFLSYYEIS